MAFLCHTAAKTLSIYTLHTEMYFFIFVFYFSNIYVNIELICSLVLYITTSVCFKEINCDDTYCKLFINASILLESK